MAAAAPPLWLASRCDSTSASDHASRAAISSSGTQRFSTVTPGMARSASSSGEAGPWPTTRSSKSVRPPRRRSASASRSRPLYGSSRPNESRRILPPCAIAGGGGGPKARGGWLDRINGRPLPCSSSRRRSRTCTLSAISPSARRISERCRIICSGNPSPGCRSASCTTTKNGTPARRRAAAISRSSGPGMAQIATSSRNARSRSARVPTWNGASAQRSRKLASPS